MKEPTVSSDDLRRAPLWSASRSLLVTHGDEFFSRWKKVVQTFEEEDVHDLRVSSRRLREGLALFSPSFPKRKTRKLIKEVKKVTRMLGDLRNTDEAYRFFSELPAEETTQSGDEVRQLLAELEREREQALTALEQSLTSLSRKAIRARFRDLSEHPAVFDSVPVDPFLPVTFFAAGAVTKRLEPVRELVPKALQEEDGPSQHQLRIAIKKFRYRLEVISPLIEPVYQELHDVLKEYQDLLGKLHDMDVFRDMVRERVAEGKGKEELFGIIGVKRRKLFNSFAELTERVPVESIGERALNALSQPSLPSPY